MSRCADCAVVLNLGRRFCDCGAVLCNGCRDEHVAECDGIDESRYIDYDLGLDDEGGEG